MPFVGSYECLLQLRSKLFSLLLSCLLTGTVNAQISLRIMLDTDEVTYKVYARSTVAYTGRAALISTAQVTLAVPHGTGSDRFEVTNLTSPIPNMRWQQTDRVDAPVESPDTDYLFFSFINNNSPTVLFDIPAGQDILLFQFTRKGNCLGSVQLINNETDAFRTPNSKGVNVGNSVSVLGALGNAYRSNIDASPTLTIRAITDPICAGDKVTLRADVSATGTAYSYQWFADDKPISSTLTSSEFVYAFPNQAATYQPLIRVNLTIGGSSACRTQVIKATRILTVRPKPEALIQYTGDNCAIIPLLLSAKPITGATYQWLKDTTALPNSNTATVNVTSSGTYAVRVTLNGCSTTSKSIQLIGVTKAERTTVSFGQVPTLLAGTSVSLDPIVTNAVSFTWSPADQLSSATAQNPVAHPTTTTTYTLTARSADGCPASDTVTVRVIPQLYFPDAFTPNHDGLNDTWVIHNTEQHGTCQVSIFNRWGILVYHSDQYTIPWNAEVNGTLIESGDYLYTIQTPLVSYQGTLTITR